MHAFRHSGARVMGMVGCFALASACGGGESASSSGGNSSGGGSGGNGGSVSGGGTGGSGVSVGFAYVTNSVTGSINPYSIDASGELLPLSPASVTTNVDRPTGIAASPSGTVLYVLNASVDAPGSIAQYAIAADGTLSTASTPTVPATSGPEAMVIHDSFAYVLNNAGTISQYDIGGDGLLTPQRTPVATASSPAGMASVGSFVYVVGGSAVYQYAIGGDGTLQPLSPASVTAGPYLNAVAASSSYVYASSSGDHMIYEFSIGADGALSPLSPPAVPEPAGFILVSGRYVYVASGARDQNQAATIDQFTIGTDGQLQAMSPSNVEMTSYFSSTEEASSLAVDPSEKYLYAPSYHPNDHGQVSVYQITAGGPLQPLNPSWVSCDWNPNAIVTVAK